MDLTPSISQTLDTNTQQAPPPTQPSNNTSNPKSSSFINGSLKRHTTAAPPPQPPPSSSMVVSYKECLRNHAATIGGHALDGCGEFMPSSSSNTAEPRSLTCAACGCHRNFHRRDHQEHNHHHHHHPNFLSFYHSPPPPLPSLPHRGLSISTSPSLSPSPSPSPSPISSPSPPPLSHHFPPYSYHHHHHHITSTNSAAPNMLLALGNACSDDYRNHSQNKGLNSSVVTKVENSHQKKRYRTKFSQEQKEKMLRFSEKLAWRMQKGDEGLVQEFCNEVGVSRGVFKVWMHNNKNNFRKRSLETTMGNNNNNYDAAAIDEKNTNGDHNINGGVGIDNPCNNNTSSSNDDIRRD